MEARRISKSWLNQRGPHLRHVILQYLVGHIYSPLAGVGCSTTLGEHLTMLHKWSTSNYYVIPGRHGEQSVV